MQKKENMKRFLLAILFLPTLLFAREIPISNAVIEDNTFIWKVIAIDFRDDCTIIHKEVTPKVAGTWICSSTDEFVEDATTLQRYHLLYSTIGTKPREIYHTNTISFTEIYPPVNQAERINIHSGHYYYKRGISVWPSYTNNPYVKASSDGAYSKSQITSVIISDESTYVSLDYYSYYDNGWVSFNSNFYITDNQHFRVNIMGLYVCDETGYIVDSKNLDEIYNVNKGVRNRIVLEFPKIPRGIHEIDIIEPEGFYWHGIKINNID